MGLTASIKELEEAVKCLTDNGRWIALEHMKALLESGYTKTPTRSDIEKEGNVIFPKWRALHE